MKKSDKKIDKALIAVLTDACEIAKDEYDGFEWLTHIANYSSFPHSLSIICVFETNEQLAKADIEGLQALIKQKLVSIDIKLKDISKHVTFDTAESCANDHNGKWNERFTKH